jgi:hypothetical protein
VTFAGTCLAVSEEAGVIPVESVVEHTDTDLVENILLIFVVTSFFWDSVPIFESFVAIMAPERVIECKFLLLFISEQMRALCFSVSHLDA